MDKFLSLFKKIIYFCLKKKCDVWKVYVEKDVTLPKRINITSDVTTISVHIIRHDI